VAIERRFFKTSEIADYLGLNRKSIYRAIARRQIPAVKVPGIGIRVDKQRLDAILENQGVQPRPFGRGLAGGKTR
jgi:excisionase family DNA binding protein